MVKFDASSGSVLSDVILMVGRSTLHPSSSQRARFFWPGAYKELRAPQPGSWKATQ